MKFENSWDESPQILHAASFPFLLKRIPAALQLVYIPEVLTGLFPEKRDWDALKTKKAVFIPEKYFPEEFSEKEQARFHDFTVAKRQLEWLCGRLAAKKLVQAFLCPTKTLASIRVENSEKGVPFLPDFPGYTLSISHGGDIAVAGLSLEKDIGLGLDVEPDKSRNIEALRRMAFSQDEWIFLSGKSNKDILRHWTLKEAGLKLMGQGFHMPLKKLEILPEGLRVHGEIIRDVSCWTADLEGGYLLSLLYGKIIGKPSFHTSFIPK